MPDEQKQPEPVSVLERNDLEIRRLTQLSGNINRALIQESSYLADVTLALEDVGWIKLGATEDSFAPRDRTANVKRARRAYIWSGLCKQIVSLWTSFGVGTGAMWHSEDDAANDVLQAYTNSQANRKQFDPQGQRTTSNHLLVDGDLFRAHFVALKAQDSKVRRIDALQIVDIAYDPDDVEAPLWYIREFTAAGLKQERYIYADWMNEDNAPGITSSGQKIEAPTKENDAVVQYVSRDKITRRGNSLLLPVLDWAKAHEMFMQSRVSLQQSRTMLAWDRKIAGGQAAINAIIAANQSGLVTGDAETNPTPQAAQFAHNEGDVLTPMKQDTSAADAQVDGSMLLQQVGVSAGIFPHYFGAGEAFRLATATAMEVPMLRQFQSYAWLLDGMYLDEFNFILDKAGISEDDRKIQMDREPVVQRDTDAAVKNMVEVVKQFPEFLQSAVVQEIALTLVGVEDATAVLEEIENKPGASKTQVAAVVAQVLREAMKEAAK